MKLNQSYNPFKNYRPSVPEEETGGDTMEEVREKQEEKQEKESRYSYRTRAKQAQIDEAKQLVATTDWPARKIASVTGVSYTTVCRYIQAAQNDKEYVGTVAPATGKQEPVQEPKQEKLIAHSKFTFSSGNPDISAKEMVEQLMDTLGKIEKLDLDRVQFKFVVQSK